MKTGIYIRAKIEGRWQSVDIADPKLSAQQLLLWLCGLEPPALARTIDIARESIRPEDADD